MPRLATTIALAAWIGFLAVFSAELLVDAISPDGLGSVAAWPWPPSVSALFDDTSALLATLGPALEGVVAVLCLGIVGLLGRSLYLIQSPKRRNPKTAETLAYVAFAGIAALTLASYATSLPLLPVDFEGGLVWLALALGIVAILFDRLVAIETEETEDGSFEAGISAIAQGMAQQTRLYTPSRTGEGDQLR